MTTNQVLSQSSTGTLIIEPQTHSLINLNNYDFKERDKITIKPGIKYKAEITNNKFVAKIDENIVAPVIYQSTISAVQRPTLNTSLQVGTVNGIATVTDKGQAQYTIPFNIPPGIKDAIPVIGINYSSSRNSGILGTGWDLSGLSSIKRVGLNNYYDGQNTTVQFSNDDRFILNGERLISINGNYGQNATVYACEQENNLRITSYGVSGTGPLWFSVKSADGNTYEYGNQTNSRILTTNSTVYEWLLTKIIDQNGNYIEYLYKDFDGQIGLDKILYTGNSLVNLEPFNTIKFYYDIKQDQRTFFVNSKQFIDKLILRKVEIVAEGKPARNYEFKYAYNLGSKLVEVIENNLHNTKFNSTLINWGDANTALEAASGTNRVRNSEGQPLSFLGYGDLDNDGINDPVFFDPSLGFQNAPIVAHVSSVNQQITNNQVRLPSISSIPTSPSASIFDYNNDGRDEIYIVTLNGSTYRIYGFEFINGSFTSITNIITQQTIQRNTLFVNSFDFLSERLDLIPVNVEGISDEIDIAYVSTYTKKDKISFQNLIGILNTNINSFRVVVDLHPSTHNTRKIFLTDINGDMSTDIVEITNQTINNNHLVKIHSFATYGNGMAYLEVWSESMEIGDVNALQLGDKNGDGNFDMLINSSNIWKLYIGKGLEFETNSSAIAELNSIMGLNKSNVHFTDMNSDGFYDIAYITTGTYLIGGYELANRGSYLNVLYSDGNNWQDIFLGRTLKAKGFCDYNTEQGPRRQYINNDYDIHIFFDINNDGNKDMFYLGGFSNPPGSFNKCSDALFMYYMCPINGGQFSNKVVEVINGFNRSSVFNYMNNLAYTKNTNYKRTLSYAGNFGVMDKTRNLVTSLVRKQHGSNTNQETIEFEYQNGVYHTLGKGFLGYTDIISTTTWDNNNKSRKTTTKLLSATHGVLYPSQNLHHVYKNNTDGFVAIHSETFEFAFDQGLVSPKQYRLNMTRHNKIDFTTGLTLVTEYSNFTSMGYHQKEELFYLNGDKKTTSEYTYTTTNNCFGPNKVSTHTVFIADKNYSSSNNDPFYHKATQYEYYANGNLMRTTEYFDKPDFINTDFEYHLPGVIHKKTVSATNMQTKIEKWYYDDKFRFQTEYHNVLNQVAHFSFDPIYGNLIQEVSINGLITKHEYNRTGRRIKTISDNNSITEYSRNWDITTFNEIHYVNIIQNEDYTITKTWFDLRDNKVLNSVNNLSNQSVFEKYIYDSKNRVIKSYKPYLESVPLNDRAFIEYEYDKLDRLRKTTDNLKITTVDYSFSFDVAHNSSLLSAGSNKVLTQLHMGQISQPMYKLTSFNQDNELETVSENNSEIQYVYHPNGNILSATAVGATTNYKYDHKGNKKEINEPNAGTITYEYDTYNRLIEQIDARNFKIEFEYDIADRTTTQTVTNPQSTNTENTIYRYFASGGGMNNIQEIANPNVIQTFSYDNKGRLTNYIENIGNENFIKSFSYDAFNNPVSITYPSGFSINQEFDRGVLKRIERADNNELIWEVSVNNYLDLPTKVNFGNGMSQHTTYDNRFNIANMQVRFENQSPLYHHSYVYNQYTESLISHHDLVHTLHETIGYDVSDRLKHVDYNHINPVYRASEINYAQNGNIERKTDLSNTDYVYGTTPPHAVIDIPDNSLDNIPSFKQVIDFNAAQRPTQITYIDNNLTENRNLTLVYAADNERRKTEYRINNLLQKTTYFVGDYEKETNSSGSKEYHYIYANGKMVALMLKTGTTNTMYYVCTDYLGNINMLIDQSRNIAQHNSFDAWGRRRNPTNWSYTNITNPTILRRGYTGHEHLDEFGLINMNARLYDPYIGRMLSPDNILQDPTNAQNYNRYSYVLNNPLKYTDPTGNETVGGSSFDRGAAAWASNAISHAHDYESWAHFFNQEKIDVYLQSTQGGGGAGSPVAGLNMGDVLASLESATSKESCLGFQEAVWMQGKIGKEPKGKAQGGGVHDVSQAGLEFIARPGHEGFSPTVYKVGGKGNPTIGFGHEVQPGEDFSGGITREQAYQLLRQDAQIAVNVINRLVTVSLNQNQFDALTSYVFNTGSLYGTNLLSNLNAGNFQGAALQMDIVTQLGVVQPGLVNRRQAEQNLFLYGIYK
jgi:RHS repeat-associated protein